MIRKSIPKIISIPYEEGCFWRKGCKFGPESILKILKDSREYSIDHKKLLKWKVDDILYNEIYVSAYDREQAYQTIKKTISNCLADHQIPISLGGDHSITFPIIQSFTEFYQNKDIHIIQLDAHSDTFKENVSS